MSRTNQQGCSVMLFIQHCSAIIAVTTLVYGTIINNDEPEMTKVDDRLSKLSLVARNVTLRLSTPTNSKKGTSSTKVCRKTIHNVNSQEPCKNSSNENANFKAGKKIKNTLCSADLNITKCAGTDSDVDEDSSEITGCSEEGKPVTEHRKISPSSTTNKAKTSFTEQTFAKNVSVKKPTKTQKYTPPEQTLCCKMPGQTSSATAKPRILFGTIRRRKSMKLGERTFVRRKSFLKKGDGINAKRKFIRQIKREDAENEDSSTVKCEGAWCDKGKMTLRMPERKDISNSTFLLGECSGVKQSIRMRNKATSPRKVIATRNKQVLNKTVSDGKTAKSFQRSRKQWHENGVQTYEALIFSSVFAFSEELRESSDVIYSKLLALYNSTNKAKANTVFNKKSKGLTKQWRQNNREFLDNGSQEIAGIFSNLRKVESNLKTVDQAVSILLREKSRSKERINGCESQRIFK